MSALSGYGAALPGRARTGLSALFCASATALVAAACADDTDTGTGGSGAAGGSSGPIVTELFPTAAPLPGETECRVTITEKLPDEGATHQEVCTPITYGTNPPSSGDHWKIWAEFRAHDAPVPREMYVHNLEHGAVVMSYTCPAASPEGCAAALTALQATADAFGVDPLCAGVVGAADRSRILITPDPLLAEPIGLSAWHATYVATCVDPPSLLSFVEAHYGKAPENLCVEGRDPSDPLTGVPACGL